MAEEKKKLIDRMEFEGGHLVKIDGYRPEYFDGNKLIRFIREIAEEYKREMDKINGKI